MIFRLFHRRSDHRARFAIKLASPRPGAGAAQKLFVVFAAIVSLAGCETTGMPTRGPQGEARAEMLAERGQHADAAGVYIGLATQQTGAGRDRLTLLAVEQWLDAGDGGRARNALGGVAQPAAGELLWLWNVDTAALALWEGRPERAMSLLDPMSRQPLPDAYRARVEALRADAWFQMHDPARAVDIYLRRENWLDSTAAMERNQRRLWAGLLVSDLEDLRKAAAVTRDPQASGWLSLAILAGTTGQQGLGWNNGIATWRQNYPGHAGELVLADVSQPVDVVLNYPRQVALLLPLSGSNAAAGHAIKNGFLGAYYSALAGSDADQAIRLYDVNEAGSASAAYAQAVAGGAEFVVGPLLRSSVGELATEMLLPVPVLTLNYVRGDIPVPPRFYQFALSPEDEAAAAAQRAAQDGLQRAVALVPANERGRRVLQSFAAEFQAAGGTLLEFREYEPAVQDFAFEIEGLMGLSQSVRRYDRLRANIGGPLQFDPRRRQDVDFIFLDATAGVGRLLKSQLKFHYSGDLPVYATSVIYGLDGRSNSDLNDVMFADTPWTIAPPARIASYPRLFADYWPAQKRQTRLHAMGYDAYQLVASLFSSREGTMEEIAGATGTLFLDVDGRVHRKLAWAQFVNGAPVPLPDNGVTSLPFAEPEPDAEDRREWREMSLEP